MLYTISNDSVRVTIDSHGAELQSITACDGTEYLWYGDPTFWSGRATNLFPYVGRMTDEKYTYEGKTYSMKLHGFARNMEFNVTEQSQQRIVLTLTDTADTREIYPFAFAFSLIYELDGATLHITDRVENRNTKTMYFGLGGHPGIRLPLEEGKCFTDYRLTFSHPCHPSCAELSQRCLMSGVERPYPLEQDTTLPLCHELFHHDAIVLHHTDRTVTLSAGEGTRGVRLHFPQIEYLGIWHPANVEAPFVCLEPWVSLPSRDSIVEDLAQQASLVSLDAGKTYDNHWSLTVF